MTSSRQGLFIQNEYFNREKKSSDETLFSIVPRGYITYRHMSDDDIFHFNINNIADYGLVSKEYPVFTTTHDLDSYLLVEILNSSLGFRKFCKQQKKGGTRTRLYFSALGKYKISLPSSKEQGKLSRFLQVLDARIEKQYQLVDSLKSYKRGLIRTLLSPNRNKRDGIEWTSGRIGDLGKFIKGAPLSKADISSEGNPFILYGELYTTYGEVVTNVVRNTKAKVDQVYYSKAGDVIIPTSGETPEEISTASCVMVPDVILAGDLNIFRTSMVDGRILSYILNHVANWKIARIAQGKSIVHVQASELAQIEITFPDPEEQSRIVSAVDGMDKIIANNETTLKQLHTEKSALMQRLFI